MNALFNGLSSKVLQCKVCLAMAAQMSSANAPAKAMAPACDADAFPDLQTGPVEVPIPHVTVTLPAADFTNSRNEVAQLTAWIAKLEHDGVTQLLRKLYDYGNGSLFGFMYMWCLAAEGFDPTADSGSELDWTESESDALCLVSKPRDKSTAMWRALQKRAATHDVNLRRVLHFLLFLYSNDRLPTKHSGPEPTRSDSPPACAGAPGELVQKMTKILQDYKYNPCPSGYHKYPEYKDPRRPTNVVDFAKLAPGWVEYMRGNLGTLRKALAFPPFGDRMHEETLYEELFYKGVRKTSSQRMRAFLQMLGERVDEPAPKAEGSNDRTLCVVCMTGMRNMVFMPCSHFVTCKLCAAGLDDCPMCRTALMGKLEVFF